MPRKVMNHGDLPMWKRVVSNRRRDEVQRREFAALRLVNSCQMDTATANALEKMESLQKLPDSEYNYHARHAAHLDYMRAFSNMVLTRCTGNTHFFDDPQFALGVHATLHGLEQLYIFLRDCNENDSNMKRGMQLLLDNGVMQKINHTVTLWTRFYSNFVSVEWKTVKAMHKNPRQAQALREMKQLHSNVVGIQTEALKLLSSASGEVGDRAAAAQAVAEADRVEWLARRARHAPAWAAAGGV